MNDSYESWRGGERERMTERQNEYGRERHRAGEKVRDRKGVFCVQCSQKTQIS